MANVLVSPTAKRSSSSSAEVVRRAEEERAERIRFSAPLLLLGAASLACAYVLYTEAFSNHATRIPIWVLALSVGLIASVGGTASLLVGDYSGLDWASEAASAEHLVVVRREEWNAIQEELAVGRAKVPREGPAAATAAEEVVLPEWEEAVVPPGADPPASRPVLGPPAPLAVTHKIDSLATEVERLVADLETSANGPPERSPPPAGAPAAARPTPDAAGRAVPAPPAPAAGTPHGAAAPSGPRTDLSTPAPGAPAAGAPAAPGKPAVARRTLPTAPPAPASTPARVEPPPVVAGEFRELMAELEQRAGAAIEGGALLRPSLPTPSSAARCVGCDAKLGGRATPGVVCRSCRSPMCSICAERSRTEGHSGQCPVCSILEETRGA